MNKQLEWEIKWINNHPELYEGEYHQKAVINNITNRYRKNEVCFWMLNDPDYNGWMGNCGVDFRLENGSPLENGMDYCCGCGRILKEEINPDIDYEFMEWKDD